MRNTFCTLIAAAALLGHATVAHAQADTVFTYQGSLEFADAPYTGTADYRFTLFDADGGVLGEPVVVSGVDVVGGLFTVPLDFGGSAHGPGRELGIEVRTPGWDGVGAEPAFTELSPRSLLAAAPHSLATRGIDVDAEGRVGIGTDADLHALSIDATNSAFAILAESSSVDGAGLRLRSNGFFRSRSWDMVSSSFGELDILTSSLSEDVSRVIRIRPTGVSVSDNLTIGGMLDMGSAGFRTSGDGSVYGELLVRMAINAGGGVLAAGGAPGPFGVNNVGYAFEGSAGDNDSGLFSLADGEVSLFSDASERVRLDGRNIAIGAGFVPQNNVHIRHQAVGGGWGIRLESEAQSVFQAGMRVSNEGFLDITNHIAGHSGFARLTSSGVWTTVSDERAKEGIHHLDGALDRAMRLDPVAYRYKGTDAEEIGFRAQNVAAEFPSLVTSGEDLMTLNYSGLSTVAIAALQELKAEKDAEIAELRRMNEAFSTELAELRRQLVGE